MLAKSAARQGGQGTHHEIAAKTRQLIMQFPGGHVGADGNGFGHADRAGIEAFFHPHDLNGGFRVAGHNGPVDRGCAAPARQHRSVQIEATELRRIENGFRQQETISDDDRNICVQRGELFLLLGVLQAFGRKNRDCE